MNVAPFRREPAGAEKLEARKNMKRFGWWLAAGAMLLLITSVMRFAGADRDPARRSDSIAPTPVASTPDPTAAPSPSVPSPSVKPAVATVPVVSVSDAISRFEDWAAKFVATDAAGRRTMMSVGETLAQERAAEMARLIRANPEEAIRRSLPYGLRKDLPQELLAQIEQPLSTRGDFRPVVSCDGCVRHRGAAHDGCDQPQAGRTREAKTTYESIVGKTTYKTFTYGDRLRQPAHGGSFLHGVAIRDGASGDHLLALNGSPVRMVNDPVEEADLVKEGHVHLDAGCPACKLPVGAGSRLTIMQFAEKYLAFCDPAHAGRLRDSMTTAHGVLWASGGSVAVNPPDVLIPDNGSGTQGIKKLLYIRVNFADDPISPQSDDAAQATVKANNKYFNDASYNTVWWESTVTPVITLPQRRNYYGENPGALLGDAAAGAAALGFFTQDYYSPHYVLHTSMPQYLFGGLSSGILNGSPGAISHELGHNFGLPHANFLQPEGRAPGPVQPRAVPPAPNPPPYPIDPDSIIGHNDINAPYIIGLATDEPSLEYGNPYEVMGSGGGHFSAMFKNFMNWLPDFFIKNVTESTTNRIYAFDTPRIVDGRLYAIRIQKDLADRGREYWLTHRQGTDGNPWFSNGIEVDWNLGGSSMNGFHLLGNNVLIDTTPDSTYLREDAALIVGRTLNDPSGAVYITPVASGGGPDPSDKWIDVVVQRGLFLDNQTPTVSLFTSNTVVPAGSTLEFVATAVDADGDQLAYNWDFGDYTFGTNGPVQSKTFNTSGKFVVRCEVSDMKGGMASANMLITVGNPTTFTISGRVTDHFGNPVEGVRVHNSGAKPAEPPAIPEGGSTNATITDLGTYRYGWTDSQGYYIIGNIPAGTYTNRAWRYGYTTTPFNFDDPVLLVDADVHNQDFVSVQIPRVTIMENFDADESGLDGIYTLTRDGDTSGELYVRFQLGGTAIINQEYFLSPVDSAVTNTVITTNGETRITNYVTVLTNRGQIYFPPGVSQLDVHVIPTNNVPVGDGDKTVTLTLLLQTNFYRTVTFLTNVLVTNNTPGGQVVFTNSYFVTVTNQFRVPGWELRPVGLDQLQTWFQTDPTYVLQRAEATVSIIDDDPPAVPAVGVFALDADALESRGDAATLLFFRIGAPLNDELVIHYEWSGLASNALDFVAMPGQVTIPAGQQIVLVPVTAVNDLFVEGHEDATISILPAPGGEYLPFLTEATVTIVDDDLPLVNIFAATATATRGGGAGVVTFSRAGSLTEPLTVNYLVTGTAVGGVDYNLLAGTVTIPAGQISANVNITPINSSTNKLPRTVTVLVADATTYNIYNQNSATVTIVDGTLPTVTLTKSGDTLNEPGGTVTFTVTRTGPTTSSLNVLFDVGGSAWQGIDYTSVGTNVVIPAGAASAGIVVNSINDNARENGDVVGFETIILQLRPGTNYLVGNPNNQTVRITDDDGGNIPAVGFMLASSSVREDVGIANLYVKVTANPATNKPIVIEYRVTGGSAVPTVNYLTNFYPYNTTGILNITHYTPPNPPPKFFEFENGIYTIPVSVLNDGVAAGNRTLTITLFNPTGYETNRSYITNNGVIYTNFLITHLPTNAYLGPAVSHTLTILDVATTTVSVSALDGYAYESGPQPARFVITRQGPTNAPLTVAFSITGTAASGSDFLALGTNGFVTIPAGTNAVTLLVSPRDDPTEEMAEYVTLTLQERPGYTVNFPDSATVIVVSDDGTMQFLLANYDVAEDGGPAQIAVIRSGNTNIAASVGYLLLDGTATNGLDYLGTNGVITFAPGETVQYIPIPIVNDLLVEPGETISLVLTNPSGGAQLGGQRAATVTILNDDTEFAFSVLTYRGNENAIFGEVEIIRLGVNTNAQSVTITATDGTADDTDYVPGFLEVEFLPGETNLFVWVQILDDDLFEGDETVNVALSDATGNATVGSISNAVLVIVDDECRLDFEVAGWVVHEYSNTVTLVVRRTGGTVNPVSVDYHTYDGTATNGFDYAGSVGTVTFTGDHYELDTNGTGELYFIPGQTLQTIQVTILDDVEGEGNENFFVQLENPQTLDFAEPGATLLGTNEVATVTILDNETPGNVDYEFGTGLGPNDQVRALALQYDNSVVIGGDFTRVDGITFIRVARLLPGGGYDGGFNPGAGANSNVHALASAPDGRVYLGGEFTTINNTNRMRIARLNTDGRLDLAFNVTNGGANGLVRAIALQADGRVIIGGDFTQVSGVARSRIARLHADGTLDTTFTATFNGAVHALAIQPDGAILVGGAFSQANLAPRGSLARLNGDGSLDTSTFVGAGFNGPVNAVAVQGDGRILAGGSFSGFNGTAINNLARLTSTGSVDVAFATGAGPSGPVNAIAVAPNKRIFIGGDFLGYNGVFVGRVARLKTGGGLDFSFVAGPGADAVVRAAVAQADTAIIIGGSFTNVHGVTRPFVARLHGDEKSNIATVEFANSLYNWDENLGPALINLMRTGNTNVTFTLTWSTSDGTASNAFDYEGITNTVTFAPGQTNAVLTIPFIDDLLLEGNETFFLAVTNGPANVDLSGQTTATVVIQDNEKAVQFASTNYFVSEGVTNAAITLHRIGGLSGSVGISVYTSNRTAIAPQDYATVITNITIPPGATSAVVYVPIVDDPTGEPAEDFGMGLMNPVGCFIGDPAAATVTIINNDFTYGTTSRSNAAAITILDAAPALPYPSTITVSQLTGLLQRVSVQFLGVYHPFPSDIDALLVGPGGQSVLLLSDAGGAFPAVNLTMTFSDAAAGYWPSNSALFTGTNRPTDYLPADSFYPSAPAGPYGSALSTFVGTSPNGTWSLYVLDDRGSDSGVISNGWRLIFETIDPSTAADLALTGSATPEPVTAGFVLKYAYTVSNAGPNVATGVIFSNAVPSDLAVVAAYPSQGSCAVTNGAVVCALGAFSVGSTATIELKTIPGLGGLLTNTASVFGAEADVVLPNNTLSIVSTVSAGITADLEVRIEDTPDPVLAGQDLTYRITVTNRGPLTATGVVVTDWLSESVDLVSVLISQGSYSNAGNALVFSVGTLPVGSGASFFVVVRPRTGGSITNTATAVADQPDITDNTTVAVTTVPPAANMVLGLDDAFDPVGVNQTVVYNITAYNAGPGQADGVTVFDILPAQFTYISSAGSQGTSFISGGSVVFQFGTIPSGSAATAQLVARATVPGIFTNYATVVAAQADPDMANNSAVVDTTVFQVVVGGTNGGITITRSTNAQQLAAMVTGSGSTGVRVTGARLAAHQTGGEAAAASSGLYTIASVPSTYGIRAPGIVLSTGDVKEYETGTNRVGFTTTDYGSTATTLQESLLDPITGGGTNNFTHHDVTQLDIDFDMLPGYGQVQFKVVFGSEEYPEFVDTLFIDGFGIFLNGSNIAFTAGAPININHPDMRNIRGTELDGVLAPGGNAVVQFVASVAAGSTNNRLTFIVADTSDGAYDTTVYITSLEGGLGANADLAVGGFATPEPAVLGNPVTYHIAVTNRGPDAATNVVVTDFVPAGMLFISATTSQGTYDYTNQTVTFNVGTLFRFGSATMTVTVMPQVSGLFTNEVTATSDLADLTGGNNTVRVVSLVTDPGSFVSVPAVVLADAGPAFTYPSVLHVSGLGSVIGSVAVTLHGLSHSFPADLDILLVGPQGQSVVLMSDVGSGFDINGVTLRFEDAAADFLPAVAQVVSGSYKPSNIGGGDFFNPPAPGGPHGALLSVFQGTDPNGDWLLYIMDDQGSDTGVLSSGWQLNITAGGAAMRVQLQGGNFVISWPGSEAGYVLESASSPAGPWTAVAGSPVVVNGRYTMTVAASQAQQFFRLRKP
jgi:uncharacterized repeat protein (TIGR01451 family)/uncharacterized delta-60 repeat protein